MDQMLLLALIGGTISAVSTSAGAFLTPFFKKTEKIQRFRLSIDFAMGVMLSTVAFSLVGPELVGAWSDRSRLSIVLTGLALGVLFIGWTHKATDYFQKKNSQNKVQKNGPASSTVSSAKVVLALALVFHNLPEGMGAGASLAGMELSQAIPLQVAIAIQNVAEGLLLALCFLSFGWSMSRSVLGSMGSGLVEFSGAAIAGVLMHQTVAWLPFLLSVAGGAMLMSVLLELFEARIEGRFFHKNQFALGLLLIPIMNLALNF
ncbi:MAG: ZIP family metal transporter [Bdellovibrio sp.]|jgi:ZIP family zinc transporter